MAWIEDGKAQEPATVQAAGFNPNRLDTPRSRTSAAYRGLYVLLQREGACDFFWKARMIELDLDDVKLDIHHILPKKWCLEQSISPRTFNAIVNKTAISYKANRMIGGKAPSQYLKQIQTNPQVGIGDAEMETFSDRMQSARLASVRFIRSILQERKESLTRLVEKAMGKAPSPATEMIADDDDDHEDDD